ncbi:GTPase activating protein [Reticulomyxa filosa]|uniref:GTPase activating protein n=1 Tax=Reticulomyxa filosa TaxID=46433 RepID=X6NNE9_RETFI|nr:GTPase activating protein [Reticulomyxa filosa]|eukprot:ETO27521.1 GTPase activating protein [Reticulomyxa filosa]
MLMTEEEAFWMLVNLLKSNGKYQLRGLYIDGLPLLHLRFFQFQKILERFSPVLAKHLTTLQIGPELYSSKWFITIYCYDFPFETAMRIWDCFLSEGIKLIFRIGLALLKQNEKELIATSDLGEALTSLQMLPKSVDTQQIIKLAFKLSIKHEHLNAAALAYETIQKQEEKNKNERKAKKKQTNEQNNTDASNENKNHNKNDNKEKEGRETLTHDEKENDVASTNSHDNAIVLDPETGMRKKGAQTMQVKDYLLEDENVESVDQFASDSNIDVPFASSEEEIV